MRVSIAILTGGNSARFGRLKQLFEVEGRPLYNICYEKFQPLSDDVFLQGRFDGADTARKDVVEGKGPLGGIYSALINARYERVFVLACDMPHLDPRVLSLLLEHEGNIVVPRWRSGYLEPLCSLYSKNQLSVIEGMLSEGVLKISELFSRIENVKYPVVEEWIEKGLVTKDSFYNMNELH